MKIRKPSYRKSRSAFSLTEVLVAAFILSILMIALSQVISQSVAMFQEQSSRMEIEEEARLVFSRMDLDFSKMVRRNDVDSVFANNQGNDSFYFYSEAPAIYDSTSAAYNASSGNVFLKNSVSLIGYRINGSYQLERLGKALNLDINNTSPFAGYLSYASTATNGASPIGGTTFPSQWANAIGTGTTGGTNQLTDSGFTSGIDTDYHDIAPDAFRLEFCFQLTNGTYAVSHGARDFSDVSSVVVTLGFLDGNSRGKIPAANFTNVMESACAQFNDATIANLQSTPPILPMQTWSQTVTNTTGLASNTGLSTGMAGQIQVFQHYFYLKTSSQ